MSALEAYLDCGWWWHLLPVDGSQNSHRIRGFRTGTVQENWPKILTHPKLNWLNSDFASFVAQGLFQGNEFPKTPQFFGRFFGFKAKPDEEPVDFVAVLNAISFQKKVYWLRSTQLTKLVYKTYLFKHR